MNQQARSEFPSIQVRDWRYLGYIGDNSPCRSNLAATHEALPTKVHPIFRFKNELREGDNKQQWFFPPHLGYQRLEPIMKTVGSLARKILLSPGSVRYIYWLLYSPREDQPQLSQQEGTPIRVFRQMSDIPFEEMMHKVNWALLNLSKHIRWFMTNKGNDNRMENTRGYTDYDFQHYHSADLLGDSAKIGISTGIRINEQFVLTLEKLNRFPLRDSLQILNTTFNFSKTLCHELIHALYYATEPAERKRADFETEIRMKMTPSELVGNTVQMLFRDESCSELGYSWENYVFGGLGDWDPFKPYSASRFYKWLTFLSSDRYLRGPGQARTATVYFMPKQYLQNIHRVEWWNEVLPEHDTALRIEKSIGIQYRNQENFDPNWDPANSSEEEWPIDMNGDGSRSVRRKQRDPSAAKANRPVDAGRRHVYEQVNQPPPMPPPEAAPHLADIYPQES